MNFRKKLERCCRRRPVLTIDALVTGTTRHSLLSNHIHRVLIVFTFTMKTTQDTCIWVAARCTTTILDNIHRTTSHMNLDQLSNRPSPDHPPASGLVHCGSHRLKLVQQDGPLHHCNPSLQCLLLHLFVARLLAQAAHCSQVLQLVDP